MKTKFQNDLQFKAARTMMIASKGEQGFMGIDGGDMALFGIFFVVMCFVITPVGAILLMPIAIIGGKLNQKRVEWQAKFQEDLVKKAVTKEKAKFQVELAALKANR